MICWVLLLRSEEKKCESISIENCWPVHDIKEGSPNNAQKIVDEKKCQAAWNDPALFFILSVRNILLNISGNPSLLKGQGSCFGLTPCRKFQVSG